MHGNEADQRLLEDIIEEVKPRQPDATKGLHFLLATPFRYQSPPPAGSRFRSRMDPAAFYGAETVKTACAEVGYWRFRFWSDSEGLCQQPASFQLTVFQFHGRTSLMIDLTKPPFLADREKWIQPSDYQATQVLGRRAREEGIEIIRSESVRNAPDGRCLTILTPEVFKAVQEPYRFVSQTWTLYLHPSGRATWSRDLYEETFGFDCAWMAMPKHK
jgi:hypothetical protein